MAENVETSVNAFPEFNPNDFYDQLIMREMLPSYEGKKLLYEDFDKMTIEEKSDEL
jgi:hypothetical protein